MNNLRKISIYEPSIKDKYYITSDGNIYVQQKFEMPLRINFEGQRNNHTKEIKTFLLHSFEEYYNFPLYNGKYIFIRNGNILLKRLNTTCSKNTNNRVYVWLYDVNDNHISFALHRLLYTCYKGNCDGYDIHHIDFNPLNNSLNNLQKLSKEEHILIHKTNNCSTTIERHICESSRVEVKANVTPKWKASY